MIGASELRRPFPATGSSFSVDVPRSDAITAVPPLIAVWAGALMMCLQLDTHRSGYAKLNPRSLISIPVHQHCDHVIEHLTLCRQMPWEQDDFV